MNVMTTTTTAPIPLTVSTYGDPLNVAAKRVIKRMLQQVNVKVNYYLENEAAYALHEVSRMKSSAYGRMFLQRKVNLFSRGGQKR